MAGTADSFPLFPKLPLELRGRIFELAVTMHRRPRVLPTGFYYESGLSTHVPRFDPTLGNVALVCREAQDAVQRRFKTYQARVYCAHDGGLDDHFVPVQFDIKRDTLSVHCDDDIPEELASSLDIPVVFELSRFTLVDVDLTVLGHPISLFKDVLGRKRCSIMVERAVHWLKRPARLQFGLFGCDGEDHEIIVGIHDTATLQRYRPITEFDDWQLRSMKRYLGRQTDIEEATKEAVDGREDGEEDDKGKDVDGQRSPDYAKIDSDHALHSIRTLWLEVNGCFEPESEPLVPWTKHPDHPDYHPDRVKQGYYRSGSPNLPEKQWDPEHPVAKKLLKLLPDFSFCVSIDGWWMEDDDESWPDKALYYPDWNALGDEGQSEDEDQRESEELESGHFLHGYYQEMWCKRWQRIDRLYDSWRSGDENEQEGDSEQESHHEQESQGEQGVDEGRQN